MTLVILLALMTGLCVGLPHHDFDAAEIMLDSLSEAELDQLLADKLEELQVGILDSYKEHLRAHENTLQQLHRSRRALPQRPVIPADYWHGYVFGTLPTRERTVVDGVTVNKVQNINTIHAVYPIDLPSTRAIYKNGLGHGYIYKDGKMKLLMVRNMWTNSMSGCACGSNSTDTSCACCANGGRLCLPSEGLQGNICVGGTGDLAFECSQTGIRPLTLEAAVAFDYNAEGLARSQSHREVVITAEGEIVTFYKMDEHGLQELHTQKGHNYINIGQNITHLGLGEIYTEEYGMLARKHFLFFFGKNDTSKVYFQVVVNSTTDNLQTGLLTPWEDHGSDMKVWQNGAQLIMGVLSGTNLHIHELLTDRWGRQQLVFVQNVALPSDVVYWKSYSSGFDKFLIAVTPNLARVYLLKEGLYKPLQDLMPGSLGAFKDIVPLQIPSCKDDVILLTGSGTTLVIFVWNNVDGKYFKANETTLSESITGWEHGFGSVEVATAAIPTVIVQAASGVAAIKVTSSLHDIVDREVQESQELQLAKTYIENEYTRQTTVMSTMQNRVDNAINVHTTTKLFGDYTINKIIVDGTLATKDLEAVDITLPGTDFASGVSYDDYKARVANISSSSTWLDNLNTTMIQFSARLEDAVKASGVNSKVTGLKEVLDGLTVSDLSTTEVYVQEVVDKNDQDFPLTQYLEGLISFSDARKITGKKTYLTSLEVTNLETPSLDDLPIGDIVTTTGQYNVMGTVSFPTLNAGDVILPTSGTVGGIDLSNAVLLSGPAKLGHVAFDKNMSVVQDLNTGNNEIDGVVVNNLYRNALTKAGGEVKGPLTFTNDVTAKSLTASLLSGVSSSDFLTYTVFKDEDSQLTGRIKLPTLTTKALQVQGSVNGRVFPTDLPLKTDATLNLGVKAFNDLTCVDLTVDSGVTVNGVEFDKLVALHRPQIITGNITLAQPVNILGNLDVSTSIVKGMDFDELNRNLTAILNPQNIFDVIFKETVSLPTVVYGGKLGGLNLVDLAGDIIYTSDSTALVTGTKTFNADLHIHNAMFMKTFNGFRFEEFVTVNDAKTLAGVKTFKKPVTFSSGLDVTGLVDGVDLKQLFDSALYLDKPGQVVTGRKTFTGTVSAGELDVQGRVSGVDFNKVLTNSGDQAFTVPQKFAAASFGALDINQIDLSDGFTVNGVDLSVLDGIRMSRKNPTPHSGVLTVNGMVSVLGSFDAVNIDGHNVAQLKNNIVTDDADSTILSDVSFASLTVKESVGTANKAGANGKNISRIHENAVFLEGNNAMTGSVTWSDLDLQGDVDVGGLVNGKDLQVVHNNAVYKDASSVQITGKKTFAEFSVKGNIDTATTNGIDLGTRLLTLDTDQDVTAQYEFFSLNVEKNLTLGGTFDAVDLEALDSIALKQSLDETNDIMFEGVQAENVNLDGHLNTVNVNARLNDAVRLQAQDLEISGRKTFIKNTTFKGLDVKTLNGKNLGYYLSHAVRKNLPITLSSNIKVNGLVSAPAVTASSLTIEGTVDNIDYKTLMTNVVLLDDSKSHGITLVFKNDLSVKGALGATSLNGFDLATNYLTTNTVQNLSPNVEFGNIATGGISVDGLVNTKKLPDEVANTLNVNGGQTVTGMKSITGLVEVANNVEVTGNTNNIKMATEAVYLSGPSTINGRLKFSNGLTTSSLTSSTNVISDLDMSDLSLNAWYYNESAIISAKMTLDSPVTMKDSLTITGTLDEFNIGQVYNDAKQALNQYSTYNEGIKSEYAVKCPLILEAYEDTEKAIFDADYFSLVQDFTLAKRHHASTTFRASDITYVIISWEDECSSTMYRFEESSGQLVEAQTLAVSGYGRDWLAVEQGQEVFLVMAATSEGNACTKQNSVVWKMSNGALSVYQDLLPGTSVSASNGILYVTAPNATHSYSFDSKTLLFNLISTDAAEMDSALLSKTGHLVTAMKKQDQLVLMVQGNEVSSLRVKVDDLVLFEQYGKILLLAAVTRNPLSGIEHHLELYSMDPHAMTLNWLDSKPLYEAATLTTFYSGNAANGKTMAVVVQESYYPTVYAVLGSELRFFADLPTPRVTWAQHLSVPNDVFPEVQEHYLLVGRGTSTKLLYLEMNGLTHEASDRTCHVDSFKYPELIPQV
ncbi:uncharacterized protein LOC119579542 [Penaeus monodon]|uniref:uncharacterized protein LOC119579542 n=1 Tax=Penaeus monodon TaxID=6687 RepID=UPI0018A775A5|nr:uncharacterized protein LOC119579542 [Penaeus monodon]